MSKRETYETKTEELLTPILDRLGFELWDVEYVKEGADYYLRATIDRKRILSDSPDASKPAGSPDTSSGAEIDKEGGITIDDCVDVSRALSDELDREDFIEDAYILEVSSPGLGRILKKDKDLERSIGRMVELKTYKPIDGCKEFTGTLKAFDKETVHIDTEGTGRDFTRSDIAKINLYVEL